MIPTNYFESWEDYKRNNVTYQDDAIIEKIWDDLNKDMFLFVMLNSF